MSNASFLADVVHQVDPSAKPEGMTDAMFLEALLEQYPAAARDITNVYLRELTESRAKN